MSDNSLRNALAGMAELDAVCHAHCNRPQDEIGSVDLICTITRGFEQLFANDSTSEVATALGVAAVNHTFREHGLLLRIDSDSRVKVEFYASGTIRDMMADALGL